MSEFQKVNLEDITINFDKQRIPLSSNERANLKKNYRYYGAQGVIDYVDRYIFDGEYLLVAEDGENLRSQNANVCNLVTGKFWVNNHAHILQANKNNNTKYIYYLLNRINFAPYITGSAQPKLNQENLNKIELRIHDLNTQNRIVSVLYAIDSKIALNNRINAELEAMAKTIYDYWFVQFDFPAPSPSGRAGEGSPYKSSGGKMVWSEELKREVPEGWEVGTLLDLGDIVGGSTPPREVNEYFCNNGTAWITPKDLSLNQGNKFITKGELDVSESGIKAASLNIMPKGTILLSSRAPIGYLAISREKVTTNQGFKSFVPSKGYSTEYVYYTIKNMIPTIENNAAGSTFKEVSASTLKSIKVCLAQKEVIEEYNKRVRAIFNRQNLLELENQHLSSLRDWLLPMLMNGQVISTTLNNPEQEWSGMMAAEPEVKYGEK
jgi:type I restriction enzyme S subunit